MDIVNLTPHAITFCKSVDDPTVIRTIEPSGQLARVSAKTVRAGEIDGIPVTSTEYSEVTGVPDPAPSKVYVVSSLVAQRLRYRNDIFIPNESIRDDKGRIIGCLSLGRV